MIRYLQLPAVPGFHLAPQQDAFASKVRFCPSFGIYGRVDHRRIRQPEEDHDGEVHR